MPKCAKVSVPGKLPVLLGSLQSDAWKSPPMSSCIVQRGHGNQSTRYLNTSCLIALLCPIPLFREWRRLLLRRHQETFLPGNRVWWLEPLSLLSVEGGSPDLSARTSGARRPTERRERQRPRKEGAFLFLGGAGRANRPTLSPRVSFEGRSWVPPE